MENNQVSAFYYNLRKNLQLHFFPNTPEEILKHIRQLRDHTTGTYVIIVPSQPGYNPKKILIENNQAITYA